MKNTSFTLNDAKGKVVEKAVVKILTGLLPQYTTRITDQDPDSLERIEFSLVDVVVLDGYHPLLGIECKRGLEKYNACLNRCGWDGDYNTPLNGSSLHQYKEAQFPVWVININQWCHKAFAADIHTILKSPNDAGMNTKRSGEIIYNNDSRGWSVYEGDFTLKQILIDIIKKEGLR